MSFIALRWAYEQKTGSGTEKSVLVCLGYYASDEGYCYPSVPKIAAMTGHTVASVRKAIRRLCEKRQLERLDRTRPDGRRTSSMYRLPIVASGDAAKAQRSASP